MTTLKMTTASTVTVTKTANYSLTFNNDVLVSAKCNVTKRFVKRSIALVEYHYELAMAEQAAKTVTIAATKILFSASIMTTLTILFVVLFTGLFFAFFAASTGNIYVKGFLVTFITTVSCGGIGLYLIDQFHTVKKQLKGVIV